MSVGAAAISLANISLVFFRSLELAHPRLKMTTGCCGKEGSRAWKMRISVGGAAGFLTR